MRQRKENCRKKRNLLKNDLSTLKKDQPKLACNLDRILFIFMANNLETFKFKTGRNKDFSHNLFAAEISKGVCISTNRYKINPVPYAISLQQTTFKTPRQKIGKTLKMKTILLNIELNTLWQKENIMNNLLLCLLH